MTEVSESWTFGTAADCDVRVADEYVSNHHCRITRDSDGAVWIEDLGSMNGTWVNGARVWNKRRIQPGAKIRIGHTDVPFENRST